MKGIDVSKWQGIISWKRVKEKVDFVIIRAGYGKVATQKDTHFERNYKGCIDNDIPCGAYWYSYAKTVEEAVQEADAFLEVLGGRELEYPVYMDVEEKDVLALDKEKVTAIIKAFLERVEKAGYWVGLYMSASPLKQFVDEDVRNRYAVWVAHYGVDKPSYDGQYGIWQYSCKGNIDGIEGDVDLNECYIDYPTKVRAAKLNNTADTFDEPDVVDEPDVEEGQEEDGIPVMVVINGETYSGIVHKLER